MASYKLIPIYAPGYVPAPGMETKKAFYMSESMIYDYIREYVRPLETYITAVNLHTALAEYINIPGVERMEFSEKCQQAIFRIYGEWLNMELHMIFHTVRDVERLAYGRIALGKPYGARDNNFACLLYYKPALAAMYNMLKNSDARTRYPLIALYYLPKLEGFEKRLERITKSLETCARLDGEVLRAQW